MARPDLTVIYYTSNREKPAFEAKIRQALLDAIGDTPLISVSHEPIDFGKNISVGPIRQCGENAIRQFQIGAQEATTTYVCSAESDMLYPQERFLFAPDNPEVFYGITYWYVLWALPGRKSCFMRKSSQPLGPITAGRELMIRSIEDHLKPMGTFWREQEGRVAGMQNFYGDVPKLPLATAIPCVSFKTPENMHRKTAWLHHKPVQEIPHWGTYSALVEKYLM